ARLAALRVPVEDLDDDAGAVEHLRARRALEVPELAGRDVVVDGHEVDRGLTAFRCVAVFLVVLVTIARFFRFASEPRLVFPLRRRRSDRAAAARQRAELGE